MAAEGVIVKKEPAIIIGNAIIWGAVILATSFKLKGTDHFADLLPILMGGAGGSFIIVAMCAVKKKQN